MVGLYFTLLVTLALYGFHRIYMVCLFLRHRKRVAPPALPMAVLPRVTVQLPVYNEMYVAERLVNAVCALEYPAGLLEIQVLDDSTDETTGILARRVAEMRERGVDIHYIHRADRSGFKAGALENGLRSATGELIAIFDADFVPLPDLLLRTVPEFGNARVGMVQVRWDHLNREFSLLTRLQAIFLDGHFVIEHTARNRSGRFFNFNGTAGVWRRQCIDDAGGWQHDTLTEDLDLSYRAQLGGWQFLFLPEITAPAELPAEMNAFKSQQHRWAKGSIQTCIKLLGVLWRAQVPLRVKLEATFHLTNNVAYLLMAVLSAILPPTLLVRIRHAETLPGSLLDGALLLFATVTILFFYLVSQTLAPGQEGWKGWRQLLHMPWLIALGIGLSLNNARAVIEALLGHGSDFVRTPKHGITKKGDSWLAKRYRGPRTWLALLETSFGVYLAAAVGLAAANGLVVTAVFVSLFAIGFLYVGVLSLTPKVEAAADEGQKVFAEPAPIAVRA
jgi:cellulose synthase/poly-beta-1,6-N-acetylglucosamine synthase-like glycosyltransferase